MVEARATRPKIELCKAKFRKLARARAGKIADELNRSCTDIIPQRLAS